MTENFTGGVAQSLLLDLLKASNEAEAIAVVQDAGVWDDPKYWRLYGDQEDNFSAAGNQQRNPDAALVEKAINSVDAVLMGKALASGVDPKGPAAPRSPREAVAIYFEGADPANVPSHQGFSGDWTPQKRTEVARQITIAMTGTIGDRPTIVIADAGEGQAPDQIPETLLSLMRGIKKRIPFVQGKFNMGGTGALRFCGKHHLQLVLSKRNPILAAKEGQSSEWGFAVVRRELPTGSDRSSTYKYLAPVGADAKPRHGGVARFESATLPIFPVDQKPYAREAEWGTLIKLFDYDTKAKGSFFMRDGLLSRLDLMMPGLMLPIRLHECRAYKGSAGSFETTLAGLEVRLKGQEEKEQGNLEPNFPSSGEIVVSGEAVRYTIYALKKGRAKTYRKNEGVLYVVNGQTHAVLSDSYFRRRSVGLDYIADSLLVVLDCTDLSDATREDLFMNSRDRIADAALGRAIEDQLAAELRNNAELEELKARRRAEDTQARLADSKPLEDVLRSILKRSPALARLFLLGTRLSNPYGTVVETVAKEFKGQSHPTYFRLRSVNYGETLRRPAHLGQKTRIAFETDVEDNYFRRSAHPGSTKLDVAVNGEEATVDYGLNLSSGTANLSLTVPEGAKVHDKVMVTVTVTDDVLIEPFVNPIELTVAPEMKPGPGGPGERKKNPPKDPEGEDQEKPAGIALPKVTPVWQADWESRGMDAYSALRAVDAGPSQSDDAGDGSLGTYDFFLNMDNRFLKSEIEASKADPAVLKAQYEYGMALVGMGAVKYGLDLGKEVQEGEDPEVTPQDVVKYASDAVAPMLLPMLNALGSLTAADLPSTDEEAGEEP